MCRWMSVCESMCVCRYVHVCAVVCLQMHVCVCMCKHIEARNSFMTWNSSGSWSFLEFCLPYSFLFFFFFFCPPYSWDLGLVDLDRLSGQGLFCLYLLTTEIIGKCTAPHLAFPHGLWGMSSAKTRLVEPSPQMHETSSTHWLLWWVLLVVYRA